jgi:exodeoxyribonuclease VII small subunit
VRLGPGLDASPVDLDFLFESAMPEETDLKFEVAVNRLEKIVDSLERGQPDLAESLASYEAGIQLLSQCYGLLDRAERSVALLTGVDAEGNPVTAAFDATATVAIDKGTPASSASAASGTAAAPSSSTEPASPKPARTRRVKPATDPDSSPDPLDPPF